MNTHIWILVFYNYADQNILISLYIILCCKFEKKKQFKKKKKIN